MSVQDDLTAAVSALDAEHADREGKATAVRDAVGAVTTALSALQSAVDNLGGGGSAAPADAPAAPGAPTAETAPAEPAPADVPPTPADISAPATLNPMTGEPVVDNVDASLEGALPAG